MSTIAPLRPGYLVPRSAGTLPEDGGRQAQGTTAIREQVLARQLEDRLSGQLARIRRQIGSHAGDDSPPGVGVRLDIRA